MLKKFLCGAVLGALTLVNPAIAATVGEAAPDFQAKTSAGSDFSLAAQKGKVVVLEWTNNECPFVKKHYGSGNMQGLQKKATADGVVWVSVISSAPGNQGFVDDATANSIAKENGAAATYIIRDPEGKIGHLYDAKTTPDMFVIDKEGKLVYSGAIDSIPSVEQADISKAQNYVEAALAEIKEGKPVAVASTKSYGCGVKY
jgi:peroxiredoxin